MKSPLPTIQAWLSQTSTKGSIVYLAGLSSAVLAHTMTKDAAVSLAIPAALGLVFNDTALIGQVSAVVTPAALAVADKPTLATVQAVVAAEEPKVVAAIPTLTSAAITAAATGTVPASFTAAGVEALKSL
jgi:hypothetical protein